jgi:membrane dipeptidase
VTLEGLAGGSGVKVPIFDGHNDTLLRLHDAAAPTSDFVSGRSSGHLDLPRARAGGMFGGFYAVFVPNPRPGGDGAPAPQTGTVDPPPGRVMSSPGDGPYAIPLPAPIDHEFAVVEAEAMVRRYEELLALRAPDGSALIRQVLQAEDLSAALAAEQHALLLHFEGAEAIAEDLSNLEAWYSRGLRSLGLVWSRRNLFGEGVPFAFPAGPDVGSGLTAAGKALVRRCDALGILLDLSHLNEPGFWDVAEISRRPLVVTHSAVHRLSNKPRNLTDRQLRAVGASGGVVGLNFNCADIRPDGRWLADTALDLHLQHLEALLLLVGDEGIALGSDFDGALMPREMPDAAALQVLVEELRRRGWSEPLLEKLAWRNWQRVLALTIG